MRIARSRSSFAAAAPGQSASSIRSSLAQLKARVRGLARTENDDDAKVNLSSRRPLSSTLVLKIATRSSKGPGIDDTLPLGLSLMERPPTLANPICTVLSKAI